MAGLGKELSNLLKHSAIYGLSNVLGKAIGFLLIPLYTHYIPPTDYGILELLDISVNVIGMFVGMGLVSAVARFYYKYELEDERNKVVSTALLSMIVLATGMLLLSWPFAETIASLVLGQAHLSKYVQISLATFALNAIIEIPLTYIRAQERSVLFSVVALSRLAFSLVLNVYFVVSLEFGILGILYSGLITSIIFSLVLVFMCLKDVGFKFERQLCWAMISFGAPLILNSFGMFIINFGDRFFLKETATLATVGVYSLGYKLGMSFIAVLIGQPFFMIWSVRCFSIVKEEGGLFKYGRIFSLYASFIFCFWLAITAFSFELMYIIAPVGYFEAYKLFPIIALGYVFRSISDFFCGAFMIARKTQYIGYISIVVTIYCIANYLFFIPRYLAMGAAIATLSTFIFMVLINWYFAGKVLAVDYSIKRLIVLIVFVTFLGAICFSLNSNSISLHVILKKFIIVICGFSVSLLLFLKKSELICIKSFICSCLNRI